MKKIIKSIFINKNGQSSLEFAVITAAMLLIILTIGMLWKLSDQGIFVEHAIHSASHHISDAAAGIVGDLFCC